MFKYVLKTYEHALIRFESAASLMLRYSGRGEMIQFFSGIF